MKEEYLKHQLGAMLREARLKKHLTQGELARKININRSYISRIENNKKNLTLKTIYKFVEEGLHGKVIIKFDV